MLCYIMLCYVMLCYVMLCYVMLCYVMLCYVMLCYVTPKIRLEAYMLVNGCLQPILMIGKVRTSPSRNGRPI